MKRIIQIIVCFFAVVQISAQDTIPDNPKVGLVLSGGGAKGLAHIGVLKKIEEAGVRIDYIGGTSMGAIIGGLYASGYTAKQLDSMFRAVDFDKLIQDDIPRSAKTFYEKNETDKYAITLPFEGFQVRLPSGISKGQNVYNLFSKLTNHVSNVKDFGELPTPFLCVATNIENGKAVVLEEGYLPRAISASGALPSLFSPVYIDDVLMVDGGVVNNYPVDEIRAKGMDIIIGVDVQDSLRDRTNLRSGLEVLTQINNFRTINDMKEKRKKTDIYLNPNIVDFTVIAFNDGEKIIEAGYDEASLKMEELQALAARQKPKEQQKVEFNKETSLYITKVEVDGLENYTRAYVLGKLKLKIPAKVTYQSFNEGINNLSATGNFQDINYRLIEDGEGMYKVSFQLRESNIKTLLRLGAHYDDLYRTGALLNVTRKRLLTNNDIASLDFIVGDNIRYNFNYYIDKGYYWSIGLNSSFDFFDKNVPVSFIFSENLVEEEGVQTSLNEIELEYSDITNQIYFETLFRRTFLLGIGAEHKKLRYLSKTIGVDQDNNAQTVFENTNYFSTYGYLVYDTYDNTFFPKEGVFFSGDFHLYLFGEGLNEDFESFSIAKAKAGYAKSIGKFTAQLTTEGGFKIGNNDTRSLDFFMGGFGFKEINNIVPFYGYEALSLRGNTYLKSGLTFDYEIFKKNHINLAANISNIGDNLFENRGWIDGVDYSGFALGYGLETFLGPLQIKYAYSPERDESEWHVSAGFKF
ncbi:patatin-like phospholipase family protein [Marinirhabdus gelatinilytica]|uniref:NTE family protein n=1 Tax=Marinirhabdus gelatinilytica TaxID=1703343 RepID=A0A370QK48_9FLAO|nr:patatin-like phospholipase family protein [Marinirhabdus gelatinilytica]RDK88706.1 NTE family protein [Marinirhabdus gelatinilytica]